MSLELGQCFNIDCEDGGYPAAAYALGHAASPVPIEIDNYARAKLIVKTLLMHARETEAVVPGGPPLELSLELAPA